MMKKITLTLAIISLGLTAISQTYPPDGLTGIALHNWLKKEWYDGKFQALGYDDARHAMYDDIDHDNGNLVGVYGGYTQSFTIGGSFNDAFPMTTEHTVPQSFFNYLEPMKSDIHHLFPSHNDVNVARSNYPLMEITDNDTDKWWKNTSYITSIPSSNIDEYSEEGVSKFEPREDHKGNAARAIFYFYTMYKNGVRTIDDCGDRDDLYNWHLNETVDTDEEDRNDKTETYQGNRNPYIDYPELVGYAWGYTSPGTNPYLNFTERKVAVHPNNADGQNLSVQLEISPAPSANETVTIEVDDNSTLPSANYTLANTSFTFTPTSAIHTLDITLSGNASGYVQLNLSGLSSAIDYGHNDTYRVYVSTALDMEQEVVARPVIMQSHQAVVKDLNTIRQLSIYNANGQLIREQTIDQANVDLTFLEKGFYVLKFSGPEKQLTYKYVR